MNFLSSRLLSYAWPIAASTGIAMLGTIGVQAYQIRGLKLEAAQSLAKATQAARTKEQEWAIIYQETTNAKETELRSVAAERDRALAGLRNRPRERLPSAALASCAGSTGRELSERDAAAFIGLAARADTIRAELDACQKREQALR